MTQENGYNGVLSRFDHTLVVANDGTLGHGYGLVFARSDQDYDNSAIRLYDDGALISSVSPTFQFHSKLNVSFTVSLDGTVVGSVSEGPNNFQFSFGPHTIASKGTNFAYSAGFADSRSAVYTNPTFDDLVVLTPSASQLIGVGPNPVVGSTSPQPFTIYGHNFLAGSTVTLRDLTAGQTFTNQPISSLTSSQIVINPIFNTAGDQWSVEVVDPDGSLTGQFAFYVVSAISTPAITGINPNPLPGSDSRQSVTLNGGAFEAGMVVKLLDTTHGDGPYYEAATVTSSGLANFSADFTNVTATWTAQVINPDGGTSAAYPFQVAAVTPSPAIAKVTAQPASGGGSNWAFTIQGTNFGSLASYLNGDNAYLTFTDSTQGFSAGYTGDPITASVSSWTNNTIQISGLAGAYGQVLSTIVPGDHLSFVVVNPQTGLPSSAYAFVAAQPANPVTGGPSIKAPSTVSSAENGSVTFSAANGNAIIVADAQAQGPYERLGITSSGGTFALATTANLTVNSGANGSNETVTGTLAALNAALGGLVFTPTPGTMGNSYNLHLTLTDLAVTNPANQLAGSATIAIIVSATPQQPGTPGQGDTEVDVTTSISQDNWSVSLSNGTTTIATSLNKSYIDAIMQAAQDAEQIEKFLDEVPGWHLDARADKDPTYSLDVEGDFFYTPGGSLDTGSKLKIGISVDAGEQVEGYFGLSVLNIGVGVGVDLGAEIDATASYANGQWMFGAEGDAQGTIKLFGEITGGLVQGEAFAQGTVDGKISISAMGEAMIGYTLTGTVGLEANYVVPFSGALPSTIASVSYQLGKFSPPPWSFNIGQIVNDLSTWADQGFILSSVSATAYEGVSSVRAVATNTDGRFVELDATDQAASSAIALDYSVNSLATFNGTNGANPISDLIADGSGDLFGTTTSGGANGDGTVFEIAKGSGTIVTLASFDGFDAANPTAGVVMDSAGNLFGTASTGGDDGYGTVFEIVSGSGVITTLASFDGYNGDAPHAALTIDGGGNLFGTTSTGGANGYGTVFEVAHASNSIVSLASFDWTTGTFPDGSLVADSHGNVYGTTRIGGAAGDGTVFEIMNGSGTITTLASFDGADGANPEGGLAIDSGGNLFGTTESGGDVNGDGTVYEIATGTGTITTLASLAGGDGANPFGSLLIDSSDNLYGTTSNGGDYGYGTVFAVTDGSGAITVLASLAWNQGAGPLANLTVDSLGDLYGTTEFGGSNGNGTVFELTPSLATSTITGAVFTDTNNNGALDAGEAGQAGVSVTLTPTGNTSGSPVLVATASDGFYSFTNVNPGTYSVGETLPIGYALTAPIGGSGAVTVTSGQPSIGPTFGNVLISSVTVNFNTLVALSQDYNKPGTFANGDLDGSGTVDFNDLVLLSQNYNKTLPPGAYNFSAMAATSLNLTSSSAQTTALPAQSPMAKAATALP
ncbi:MAG TPA: choice-of-anchor tandem repeat GloVer-containing protein, partial [Humisphaera sp.]|nr:choice-of-anchor tandem repeat GloVer-containing protein [Humisphaera sp.]